MNKAIYLVCVNWDKVKTEKPRTIERLKYVKLTRFNECDDIAGYVQFFDNYDDGWRIYIYTTFKKAKEMFDNITLN